MVKANTVGCLSKTAIAVLRGAVPSRSTWSAKHVSKDMLGYAVLKHVKQGRRVLTNRQRSARAHAIRRP